MTCGALICSGENALWDFDFVSWETTNRYESYQLFDYLFDSGFSGSFIYQFRWAYKNRWSFTNSGLTAYSTYLRNFFTNELTLLLPVLSGKVFNNYRVSHFAASFVFCIIDMFAKQNVPIWQKRECLRNSHILIGGDKNMQKSRVGEKM